MNIMKGVNSYGNNLSDDQIKNKAHRNFVGGLWDEIGRLQFEFIKNAGLNPNHKLLDIGCGCLRGGIHFIDYLNEGNYYGLDINSSLIEAGKIELEEAGLTKKNPNLIVNDSFLFENFNTKFDFMISISVFTHLPMNIIIRCLKNVKLTLNHNGVYYSTFFLAPESAHLEPLKHHPGGIVTNYDRDPFHYSNEELYYMANSAGLNIHILGDWGHPRDQKMAVFSLK
ncbi:MAG: class I SAM-dependent methyltransferase [Methylococcaceae bacterium]|nr:class I SAM-dependent methyltransferase [Methylococcaceae bacterium]